MTVKIEQATTCFVCGIQTHYEVSEYRVMTPQEFLNTKLAYLSNLIHVTVQPLSFWHKDEAWHMIAWGTPMINGKYQGCTSVWFTIKF